MRSLHLRDVADCLVVHGVGGVGLGVDELGSVARRGRKHQASETASATAIEASSKIFDQRTLNHTLNHAGLLDAAVGGYATSEKDRLRGCGRGGRRRPMLMLLVGVMGVFDGAYTLVSCLGLRPYAGRRQCKA